MRVTANPIGTSPWRRLKQNLGLLAATPWRWAGFRPQSRSYQHWVELYDRLSDEDRLMIEAHIGRLANRPLISVVMPVYDTPEPLLREAIQSVRAQLYPHWELCVADDASPSPYVAKVLSELAEAEPRLKWMRRDANGHISAATNSALGLASGDFIALMDHDDRLAEHALYEIAVELNAHPEADLIYSDEDRFNDAGLRFSPYFKTDWNPELFFGHNMISHLGVYRRSLIEKIGGLREGFEGSQDYDLALRVVAATSAAKIRHIPEILYHWRHGSQEASFSESQLARCIANARKAKADYFARRGESVEIMDNPAVTSWERIKRAVQGPPPLVSLIVTAENGDAALLRNIETLLLRTAYRPLEIVIVIASETVPPALANIDFEHLHILRHEGRADRPAMIDRAAAHAQGTLLAFIDESAMPSDPGWLDELVSLAVLPHYGAIGAKLLRADGRVLNGGIVLGLGEAAGSAHVGAQPAEAGYFGRLAMTSNVSAVSGACLVVRKALFDAVGGLDLVKLPKLFWDVDFCLKIAAAGFLNVWTPYAAMTLQNPPARVLRRDVRREAMVLRERWGAALESDPFYNPNLSLSAPGFDLAFPPRVVRPWRANEAPAADA